MLDKQFQPIIKAQYLAYKRLENVEAQQQWSTLPGTAVISKFQIEVTKMQASTCGRIREFLMGALLVLFLAALASAQIDTASLVGTIKDPTAAVVEGAKVTVTNMATGETQSATTGSDGAFVFSYLRVGTYTVTVESTGFKKAVSNPVSLDVQDRKQVDIQLQLGSAQQVVDVTVEAPLLDTQTADVGNVVSGQQA